MDRRESGRVRETKRERQRERHRERETERERQRERERESKEWIRFSWCVSVNMRDWVLE